MDSIERTRELVEQAQDSCPAATDQSTSSFFPGPSAFWVPARLVESAWLGHIPFAFWLIDAIRPSVFVELGTHTGASYCAFCQAIDALSLGTVAYAIDSWEGDKHAGFYGDSVFDELNQYNIRTYEGFSRLLRHQFDDALRYFNDGEIDLLHIDGLHTYDFVRHDFEHWLPKMSSKGIVLLHDINVRERDFGVWRLWAEIAARYPSFTFNHHHGLGVACVGDQPPQELDRLMAAARDPQATALWRGSFARLGQGIQVRWEAGHHAKRAATLAEEQEALRRQLADGEAANRRLAALVEEMSATATAVKSERDELVAERDVSLREHEALLADAEAANRRLAALVEEMSATATAVKSERDELVAERDVSLREHEALEAKLAEALARCGHVEGACRTLSTERDHVQRELDRHKRACDMLARELAKHRRRRQKMKQSLFRRSTRPVRAVVGTLLKPFKPPKMRRAVANDKAPVGRDRIMPELNNKVAAAQPIPAPSVDRSYEHWIAAYDTVTDRDKILIAAHITTLQSRPLISVLMPVYNPSEVQLRAAIDSVQAQLYPNWELCIADDASTLLHVRQVLESYRYDRRVKVAIREQNGHIAAASNTALCLAEGEFVALMDHDDLLPPHALYELALAINERPDVDLIYTDEDRIDAEGRRQMGYFKTDWDPDLMLTHNMVSHFGAYRRSKLLAIDGFRDGYDGSQDYDLTLRFARVTSDDRVCHIPAVLYHWRINPQTSFSNQSLDKCIQAARRAVRNHLEAMGIASEVSSSPAVPADSRVTYRPATLPVVSVIIPTRDRADLLAVCLDGVLKRTDYDRLDVIVVDNESSDAATLRLLGDIVADERVRVMPFTGPFNYSAMNNYAVEHAIGDVLLLLNNDIDVIEAGWLKEMVSHAIRPTVGAVGAKLLYPNGTVQHAGVALGVGGCAFHIGHGADRRHPGYFGLLTAVRTVSAVTAACLAVRRDVFVQVGGFDAINLKVAFNDVDFCLRIRERGYRNVFTPFAELYHHESVSRGLDDTPEKMKRFHTELEYMQFRWKDVLFTDPYYGPNFDLGSSNFELGFPPRRIKPWKIMELASE